MRAEKELSCFLSEYAERNDENVYPPVAVGRYGIRARESIYTKELAKDYSKNKLIFRNTLTVGMGSVQIDIGVLTDDKVYSVSPAYHTFRVSGINADYLRYCLECRNRDMFARYVKRGSRQGKSIDLKRWLTYQIPVYFDAEQQEIVSRLDAVSRQIEARRAELDLLGNLVKSRFVEMFGDLTTNELGWTMSTVGKECFYIKDGPHKSPKYVEDGTGIPFISTRNVVNGPGIDWSTAKYISEADYLECIKKCHPEKGDILYSKGGTTGVARLVDTDIQFANWVHLAVLKFGDQLDGKFFEFMLNSDFCYQQSQRLTKGIANRDFVLSSIAQVQIIVPPMYIQREFVGFVAQVDKSRSVVQRSIAQLELLKASLMQEYFG